MSDLKDLKNNMVVNHLKNLVGEERKILNEILEYLNEVNLRKIYLTMAYSSLFDFCVRELGYSQSAAYRRTEALKLLKSLTEDSQKVVKSKIQDGTLNLTHLTQVQGFFKQEKKLNDKVYTSHEKSLILERLENKSKLEAEKELVKISPQSVPVQSVFVRPLTRNKIELKLTVDETLVAKLEKLKALKSHVKPGMTTVELIDILANEALKKYERFVAKEQIKIEQINWN